MEHISIAGFDSFSRNSQAEYFSKNPCPEVISIIGKITKNYKDSGWPLSKRVAFKSLKTRKWLFFLEMFKNGETLSGHLVTPVFFSSLQQICTSKLTSILGEHTYAFYSNRKCCPCLDFHTF